MSKVVVLAGSVALHMLQDLQLAPIYQAPSCIIPVCCKAPSFNWVKVNTDGSLVGAATTCCAIFSDANGAFLGGFSCKLDCNSVLHVELLAIIIAIDKAHTRGCRNFGLKATLGLLYSPLKTQLLFLGTCEIVGITVSSGICSWSFLTPIVKGIFVPTS
jgi:hypothetical protein